MDIQELMKKMASSLTAQGFKVVQTKKFSCFSNFPDSRYFDTHTVGYYPGKGGIATFNAFYSEISTKYTRYEVQIHGFTSRNLRKLLDRVHLEPIWQSHKGCFCISSGRQKSFDAAVRVFDVFDKEAKAMLSDTFGGNLFTLPIFSHYDDEYYFEDHKGKGALRRKYALELMDKIPSKLDIFIA